ncbi:MAG: hypothetical protein LC659_15580 [Myxococcales bacterium]|nr:hypothetical protein [Myxococcales bacterium]
MNERVDRLAAQLHRERAAVDARDVEKIGAAEPRSVARIRFERARQRLVAGSAMPDDLADDAAVVVDEVDVADVAQRRNKKAGTACRRLDLGVAALLVERLLALDNITNRADQQLRSDLPFDEIVLRTAMTSPSASSG